MLERAYMIGYRQGLYTDDELTAAFDLATHAAAQALGLADYGLAIGSRANLVAVAASGIPEAVASPPTRRLVIHDGRIVHNGLLPGTDLEPLSHPSTGPATS
jgi:cytosine deaminase